MSSISEALMKYTTDNYGDLIVPDKANYDDKTKIWEARLRSTYPRIIEDEKSKEVIVRFLRFTDLGSIRLSDKFEVIDASTSEYCEQQLIARLELWKRYAEHIVVSASSEVFAKIFEGLHVLHPLWLILNRLATHKTKGIVLLENEVAKESRPEKIRQYLKLLEELKIVRQVDNGYDYDNGYVALLDESKKQNKELKTVLLSFVIRQKYDTLKQVFGINQLDPFIRLANAYYWPSLDAEKLVHTTRSHLYLRYNTYYRGMPILDFESKLSDLVTQGAIIEENGYLTGDKEQFENMLKIKYSKVDLNP
jgi:hypothetical protein